MRNIKTKEILNSLSFIAGDQSKAASQPSAAEALVKGLDSQPFTRNGVYYRGLADYEAKQKARRILKERALSDELITKQLAMDSFIPPNIITFSALDEYRQATQQAEQLTADTGDLLALMGNITSEPEIEAKGPALAALVDEFKSRLARLPEKTKDRMAAKAIKRVSDLADLFGSVEKIRASLDRMSER